MDNEHVSPFQFLRASFVPFCWVLVLATLTSACSVLEVATLNLTKQTTFEVVGNQLIMNGLINRKTPDQLLEALQNHPGLIEVVMHNVPGSVDDEANLLAAGLLRKHGLNTRLVAESEIASGGTDLYLAGVERSMAPTAKIGVHSWAGMGFDGSELPRDDSRHRLYLDYYETMGIPADFYWFTLEAASADGIHWMTEEEIARYGIVTKP